jgi:hypothetical protein
MMKKYMMLILVVVVLAAGVLGAAALTKWDTVALQPGQGLFVPCSSGIVVAYIDDGMAVVECLPQPKGAR